MASLLSCQLCNQQVKGLSLLILFHWNYEITNPIQIFISVAIENWNGKVISSHIYWAYDHLPMQWFNWFHVEKKGCHVEHTWVNCCTALVNLDDVIMTAVTNKTCNVCLKRSTLFQTPVGKGIHSLIERVNVIVSPSPLMGSTGRMQTQNAKVGPDILLHLKTKMNTKHLLPGWLKVFCIANHDLGSDY